MPERRRCSTPVLRPESSASGPHEPDREELMGKITSSVWAGLAALAIGCAAPASADTVKIGLILPYSGPFASLAATMDDGIKLWMKQNGDSVGSTKIELIRRDDTGPNPDVAKRLAQELITRDKVQFLTGAIWTPNATAIAPLTQEAKVPFVIMNAAGVNIVLLSPYIVRTSFTLWQSNYPLGQWAAK